MTPENIYLKLKQIAKEKWPDMPPAEVEKRCFVRQSSGVFDSGDYWKDFHPHFVENTANKFGVLSLSSKSDKLLMWSHYANSHNGFCVGFDTKILFDTIGGLLANVWYRDEFPELGMFDGPTENVSRLLNTKSKHWFYESEFRLRKAESAKTTHKLPNECIKEIILGCKMDRKN